MKKYTMISIIISVIIILIVSTLSKYAPLMRPWQIVISSLSVIIPIILTFLYSSKIHKIHRLQLYKSEGFIFKILSGNTISTIICIIFAIIDWSLIFGQLTTQNFYFNIYSLSLYIILLYISKIIVDICIGQTYKDFYKPIKVIFLSSILSSILSSLIFAYFDPLQLDNLGYFQSIKETNNYINNQYEHAYSDSLALFQELIAFKDSLAIYFISKYSNEFSCYIINFISQFVFFLGIGPFLGIAFIKFSDLKRIWCPPSEVILQPKFSTIFWSSFLAFIGILGYAVLFVSLENTIKQEIKPVIDTTLHTTIEKADKIIAEIDPNGNLLQPGTVESYNNIAIKAASIHLKNFVEEEIRLVDKIYTSIENNVDKYLDWYYSLAADYARLGKMLMGSEELENYMSEKFQEYLYSQRTETYLEELSNLEKNITKNISLPSYSEFIKDKIVDPKPWDIVEKIPSPPIITYPEVLQKMNITDSLFNTRMATATGVGIAGAIGIKVLSKKIAGKVAAKGAFKMGAKVLAKVATKTAAGTVGGATGGATIGATIGSVIPGLGTVFGGIIGGAVGGAIAWIATDEIFLKAEELLGRNTYKQEILSAIREEKNLQISKLRNFLNKIESNI